MGAYILGALTMLLGVMVGHVLSNKVETEETVKWTNDISETSKL